ncbi:MAG: ChbG/HpnK family deacetylase [Gemmataceae bacterium]|nr:ChbG/HpnK family deacetylase [Gemmataceae bacterium]
MDARRKRKLLIIADDFGIGPATTQGILELARTGVLSGTVLIANSLYARDAAAAWRRAGRPIDLGWHPNLTLDAPVLSAERVPSLVRGDGRFRPIDSFLRRLFLGRIRKEEVAAELSAQLDRFFDLAGSPPTHVNAHQHVGLFEPVRDALLNTLARLRPAPYVRRVREPWSMLWRIPGARAKRAFLNHFGRRAARRQKARGFPGNDWLLGISDPPCVKNHYFFDEWLLRMPGEIVEMACHPGREDSTLLGRDCRPGDGLLQRRVDEFGLLRRSTFLKAVHAAGFEIVSPSELIEENKTAEVRRSAEKKERWQHVGS